MIKPLNNCILVELSSHQVSANGLELPVKEEDKLLRTGKVLEVPKEDFNGIFVGDNVVFGEYAFNTLLFEGKYHVFVDYQDIIGKIV